MTFQRTSVVRCQHLLAFAGTLQDAAGTRVVDGGYVMDRVFFAASDGERGECQKQDGPTQDCNGCQFRDRRQCPLLHVVVGRKRENVTRRYELVVSGLTCRNFLMVAA